MTRKGFIFEIWHKKVFPLQCWLLIFDFGFRQKINFLCHLRQLKVFEMIGTFKEFCLTFWTSGLQSLWFLYWASSSWSLWSGCISFMKIDHQIEFANFSLLDFIQIFQANWENWVKLTLQCICTWWLISKGWSSTKTWLFCTEAVLFFFFKIIADFQGKIIYSSNFPPYAFSRLRANWPEI